jgi:hypothetical protein
MYGCHHWLWWFLLNLSGIQESAIGRRSTIVRNFLIRFKEKEIKLARGWCMKECNRCIKTFEAASKLDYWHNWERVEFGRSNREFIIGWVAWSSWYDTGVLETEPSPVSSRAGLGQILFWFSSQVFYIKAWAMGLVCHKGEATKRSCVYWGATSAMKEGWGHREFSMGVWTIEEALDTRDLGTLLC